MVCAVAGVALTQRPDLNGMPFAAWAALFASGFTAVAMLGLNRLRGVSSLGIVVHFSAVATVFGGAAFLAFDRPTGTARLGDWPVALKLLGVGATATVGQVFLTLAFGSGAPAKVSVVGLTQIVMVLAFDAVLWGREVNAVTVVGTLLVITPTAWLLTRPQPGSRRAPREGEAPAEPITVPALQAGRDENRPAPRGVAPG